MRLVILESPYMGRGRWWLPRWLDRWANIRYARAAMKDSLKRNEAPSASHLLYTQPGVLDDNKRAERDLGIAAGLEWRRVAEGSVVYSDRGITPGMKHGIRLAMDARLPVEYRTLGKKWVRA